MIRDDHLLVRRLFESHGDAFARAWQRIPYVIVPGGDFPRYVLRDLHRVLDDEARDDPGHGAPALPWDEVVLDLGDMIQNLCRAMTVNVLEKPDDAVRRIMLRTFGGMGDSGTSWCRVRRCDPATLERDFDLPWLARDPAGVAELLRLLRGPCRCDHGWIRCEFFDEKYLRTVEGYHLRDPGFAVWPDTILVPRATPRDPNTYFHVDLAGERNLMTRRCDDCEHQRLWTGCAEPACDSFPHAVETAACRNVLSQSAQFVLGVLAYVRRCDEYMVEATARVPEARRDKARKTARTKPWLREDLPRTILVRPGDVKRHGHPAGDRQGTHASPRPHPRRGHDRTLSAERFRKKGRIWIKPAWIGETRWEDRQTVYRIVEPDWNARKA